MAVWTGNTSPSSVSWRERLPKSAEMVARYVREADKWTKNGLKGVGF